MVRLLRRFLRAVRKWLRGFWNSSTSEIPRISYLRSQRKLQHYRKWRKDNPSRLYLGEDKLELLRDLRQHKGWAVFEELIELRLGSEVEQLATVQPQDQTNFRRGVLTTYATLTGLIDTTLEELDRYYDRRDERERKRREYAGPDIGKYWGSPNWFTEFTQRS